jgi:hypothetical protein
MAYPAIQLAAISWESDALIDDWGWEMAAAGRSTMTSRRLWIGTASTSESEKLNRAPKKERDFMTENPAEMMQEEIIWTLGADEGRPLRTSENNSQLAE